MAQPKPDKTEIIQRPQPPVPAQPPQAARPQAGSMGRVLVVDDNAALRQAHGMLLQGLGYEVVTASSGLEALKVLQEQGHLDAILSDISMPGMDGLTFLRTIRSARESVPVILITGEPSMETVMKALEYGALRYLRKPANPAEIGLTVKQAVTLHRMSATKAEIVASLRATIPARRGKSTPNTELQDAIRPLLLPVYPLRTKNLFAFTAEWTFDPKLRARAIDNIAAVKPQERQVYLGTAVRARIAQHLDLVKPQVPVMVRLHPQDLSNEALFEFDAPLARHANLVYFALSVTEELSGLDNRTGRLQMLRKLGYHIALTDFGPQTEGISEYVRLSPDYVMVDAAGFNDMESEPGLKKFLADMVALCKDTKVTLIAQGACHRALQDSLAGMGVELFENPL